MRGENSEKVIVSVFVTFFLMVLLTGCMRGKSKDDNVDNSKQSTTISYEEVDGAVLIKEAQENAAAANHKYKGKNVKINNVQVSSIDSDGDYISLDTQNSQMSLMNIRCSINKKDKDLQNQVYAVKNGQKVIIQGYINEIGDVLGVSLRLDKIEPASGDTQNIMASVPSQSVEQSQPVVNNIAPREIMDQHWYRDSRTGVFVWNPKPTVGETVTWQGGYVSDGNNLFADGNGVATWYLNGEYEQRDEGIYHNGIRDGVVVQYFPDGRIKHTRWVNGTQVE